VMRGVDDSGLLGQTLMATLIWFTRLFASM
jgi:hypothetical protein